LAAARRLGGVVLPTLHIGTERERDPKTLQSLGFDKNEYVVGMDFPKARGLYRSFYFPEEVFALVVRGYIELSIAHGYRFIYIINGHGAVNHNEVLKRLCAEFSNKGKGIQVACSIAFPRLEVERGSIAHAGYEETSLLRYYDEGFVDLSCLPHRRKKLKYTEYSIVDSGGFSGRPGDGYAVPDDLDPRIRSSKNLGKKLFDRTVEDIVSDVRKILVTKKKRER
jgi:creatinine amidohydrolase/Fe(II)-dependent formamide hydrolase-like protein